MKKILLMLIVVTVSVFAKPCTTDIYFGNGVGNSYDDAEDNMIKLREFMLTKAVSPLSIEDEKNGLYSFKLAYNPARGTADDLAETYWQLFESGQISEGYFSAVYLALAGGAGASNEEFLAKLRTIISIYNDDANAIYQLYNNASFSQKHNVLLVAHSQGNLFGNKMYTLMSDAQKKKFRMVSVATPANSVAGGGPYVTVYGDYVIAPIANALPSNTGGVGHTFLGTYLNLEGEGIIGDGSQSSPILIGNYIRSVYNDLMRTTVCESYEGTYVQVHALSKVDVYGFTASTIPRKNDLLATISLETFPPTKDANNNLFCGDPTIRWGGRYLSSCNSTNTICTWDEGNLYEAILESKKGTAHHVLYENQCATLSLTDELYDVISQALKE